MVVRAHCPCTPFPVLIAEGLEAELGAPVGFVNRTTNGGTSADLLADFQSNESVRDDIGEAELIVVSTGANDLEPAFEAYGRGECGGADDLDCFRAVAEEWRVNFDGMLAEIEELRAGQPTGGAAITAMHHDALCEAAAALTVRPVSISAQC